MPLIQVTLNATDGGTSAVSMFCYAVRLGEAAVLADMTLHLINFRPTALEAAPTQEAWQFELWYAVSSSSKVRKTEVAAWLRRHVERYARANKIDSFEVTTVPTNLIC